MKTSELTDLALDRMVAKCEEYVCQFDGFNLTVVGGTYNTAAEWDAIVHQTYKPSSKWSQGGLIIDREKISLIAMKADDSWMASWTPNESWTRTDYGPTPLIAAMRAYVQGKLGDEIDVPKELIPIDMILHCPACGVQHIDGQEITDVAALMSEVTWNNPPHRSHLCHGCGYIWRPADVPTNGVVSIKTKDKT